MLGNIKLILFDLDGVLINSITNMETSWKKVQKDFNLSISFNKYSKHIGLPFKNILKKIGVKKDFDKIEKCYQFHSIKSINKIKMYPSVKTTLKTLKKLNIKVGIVTSKDRKRTLKLLKKNKLNFEIIVTPKKNLRGKPNPDQLEKAIKIAKIDKKNTVYVGDMLVDFKAAKNSNINYIHTEYGYGKKNKIYKYSIKRFNDIIQLVA